MKDNILNNLNHNLALQKTGFWGQRAAGAIFFSNETKRFMLGYRSDEVLEPHTYGTFGGAIDINESIKSSVRRELKEETGQSDLLKLNALHIFKSKGFRYYNYIAFVEKEFSPCLNWENENYKWFTLNKLISCKNLHFGMANILEQKTPLEKLKKLLT
jgi:8-oxo-dGTP pyrophosphatase MutT (NUDIX family)